MDNRSRFIEWHCTDAAAIEKTISTPGFTLLKYVEDGKIIGCVELHKENQKLYPGMLTVQPDSRVKALRKHY